MSETEEVFDEPLVEALGRLFEQFWVLRDEEPEAYRFIREHENKLKRYVQDKFGYDVIVHQHFAKLEKIPVEPKSWMGIQSFTEPMDYAIFCCALAYTEQKALDEQFLLSDLAESIETLYPGEFPLDWTNYNHRRSLVRALKEVNERKLMKTIDGNIELFQHNEEEEVLYEVTQYARYFMRSYPDELFRFHSIEEMLEDEWRRQPDGGRRKRVYRKLMLSPFVHRQSENDADFAYIRNFRNRLRDDFEKHTPFRLEVFKNVAMLTIPEAKRRYTLFPDNKGLVDVCLHVMTELREKQDELAINEFGEVRLPIASLEQTVRDAKERTDHGWAKKFREERIPEVTRQVVKQWQTWEMADWDETLRVVTIRSGAARLTSVYPKDYLEKVEEEKT
ncbi:TIGR02678 family protein [Shouchella shacheensis]|uniref:TIGR02678 family protein n=1 Tax=Shouchella shacheensis TaxID=1649580 RepID=UPI000740428A|nr:TIGR02678 family protein [Shouchella shacheensis]